MVLLAVAGNETTRNAISHGMHAFFQNPDQWELYKATRPATAGDEIIRWATPVTVFQRTALNDVEIGGVADRQGRAGRSVLRERELRRGRVHRPVPLRHHPRPQPAPGLRRPRGALLHRRQPGPARGQPDLRGPGRPRARTSASSGSRGGCGTAGSTASRTCRSPTANGHHRARSTDVTTRRSSPRASTSPTPTSTGRRSRTRSSAALRKTRRCSGSSRCPRRRATAWPRRPAPATGR